MHTAGNSSWKQATPAVLLGLGLLTGCATYQQKAAANLAAFNAGQSEKVIAYYTKNQSGTDKQLNRVEAGRLLLLEGDFASSQREFEKAIAGIFDITEGAMIRLKDVGGTVMSSTFLDDTTRPYNLPSFEAVFTFQQQALNWIFQGDVDAAAVELRRAVAAQDLIAEEYSRQIEKAKNEATGSDIAPGMEAIDQQYANMGPVLGRAMSGFQNPYVWYFSGLMYENQYDNGNAYLAYKKAWELVPDNPTVQRDLLRLSRTENRDEWRQWRSRFQLSKDADHRPPAEILVLYEESLISQRHSVGIPIFLIDSLVKVTFPVYIDAPYQPGLVHVTVDGHDQGRLAPVCYVQSLAYHDLKERLPGITARNISRAITRELTARAGRKSDDSAVQLAALIGASFAAVADEADTRGWYSLPNGVQLLRFPVEPGERTICLTGLIAGNRIELPMTLERGERKLIWVADLGPRASIAVASLTHPGKSPVYFEKIIHGLAQPVAQPVVDGITKKTQE